MCEKKPGRRCSSDARATLSSLSKAQKKLDDQVKAAQQAELTAGDDPNVYNQSDLLRDNANTHRAKLREARLNYNATPDGLAELEKRIKKESPLLREETYKISDYDFEEETNAEVKIDLPGAYKAEVAKSAAEKHRAWQSNTLKSLEEAEKQSLDQALFTAQVLRKNIQDKISAERKARWEKLDNFIEKMHAYRNVANANPKANENERQAFGRAVIQNEQIKYSAEYNEIKFDDLKAYEDDIAAKIYEKEGHSEGSDTIYRISQMSRIND